MSKNKIVGAEGEKTVIRLISCPNCQKKLMLLPQNYPLYDVQCTGCTFRVQVKTVNSKPKSSIFGAGYDIYEKVLKAGVLAPSLIVNFQWQSKGGKCREIRFYPFVARGNIQKYTLSAQAKRGNYRMFKYVKLDKIPYFVLFQEYSPSI